jgi:hypothetical protein
LLILDNCVLLATPKTGSKWCHAALLRACSADIFVRDASPEEYHTLLKKVDPDKAIAFVRHPLTWYRSYWNHRMRNGWQPDTHLLDQIASANKFEEFVQKATSGCPGFLSEHIQCWAGTEEKPAGFIGRHEHLADDLAWAMKKFRVPFNEQLLRETPRKNTSNYVRHPARYTDRLQQAVLNSEAEMLSRFYDS